MIPFLGSLSNRVVSILIGTVFTTVFAPYSQEQDESVQGPVLPPESEEAKFFRRSIPQLSGWPSNIARSCASSLVERGPKMAPSARRGIEHVNVRVRAGAAWVLGHVGNYSDFGPLKKMLFDPSMRRYGEAILAGLSEIDSEATRQLAFGLLESDSAPHRSAGRRFMAELVPRPVERDVVLRLARGDHPDLRRDAFRLAKEWNLDEICELSMEGLDDPDNRIRRTSLLSLREILGEGSIDHANQSERAISKLKSWMIERIDRRSAPALLLLVELKDLGRLDELPLESIKVMEESLGSLDPLVRSVSALALIAIGYGHPDLISKSMMGSLVNETLVTTLFTSPTMAFFSETLEIATPVINRVLGSDLSPSLVSWRERLLRSPSAESEDDLYFRECRAAPVGHEDLDITWSPSTANAKRVLLDQVVRFRGPNVDPHDGASIEYVLDQDQRVEFLQVLNSSGAFDSKFPRRGRFGRPHLKLLLSGTSLDLAFLDPSNEEAAEIESVALELFNECLWQAYAPKDRTFLEFWSEELAIRRALDEEGRLDRTLRLIESRLGDDSFDQSLLAKAIEDTLQCIEGGARLSQAGVRTLIRIAITQPQMGRVARGTATALGTTEDPFLFAPLAHAMLDRYGVDGEGPTSDLMLSLKQLATSLSHRDPRVRRLAINLWAKEEPDRYDVLVRGLDDPDPSVQEASAEGLGNVANAEAGAALLELARSSTRESVRSAALKAAGKVGVDGATDLLLASLKEESSALRIAAIKGMAYRRDPRISAELVTMYAELGPKSPEGVLAALSMRLLGGSDLTQRLWPLGRSSNEVLRIESIFLLAELGDTRVLSDLVDLSEIEAYAPRARVALSRLTCREFDQAPWLYRTMAETGWSFAAYFLDALENTEFRVEDFVGDTANREIAVPFLLDKLIDSRWTVREGARLLLREFADLSGPLIPRRADDSELMRLRREWESCVR